MNWSGLRKNPGRIDVIDVKFCSNDACEDPRFNAVVDSFLPSEASAANRTIQKKRSGQIPMPRSLGAKALIEKLTER